MKRQIVLFVAVLVSLAVSAQQPGQRDIVFGTDLKAAEVVAKAKALAKQLADPTAENWRVRGDQRRTYYFEEAKEQMPFRVCVPDSWDGKSAMPMVVFLHGGWNDESSYLDQNDKQLVKIANQYGVLLVSPLGAHAAYGNYMHLPAKFDRVDDMNKILAELQPERIAANNLSEQDVINVIELVLAEYPVDRKAMFLMGHSMGSGGTWYLGAKYPDYWRALVPISGPFTMKEGYPWERLKNKPIFMTEGLKAGASLESSRQLYQFAKDELKLNIQYKEVDGDHGGMFPMVLDDCFQFIRQNSQRPPLTPAWALGHVVWEDSLNTTAGAEGIVDGYLKHDIPVDAVIIDSPWSTAYNDFNWDRQRYADPAKMIKSFSKKGVRTILWLTGNVNEKCKDTPQQKCIAYDEVVSRNYGVNNSQPYSWWKGFGQHIDFTNAEATQWWYQQLDKVFTDGVYGWKTDQGEQWLPKEFETSKGRMTNEQFRHYYYDAMYDYTVSRKRDGIIIARPFSHQGGLEASVEKMNMGWCGDFSGNWGGLKQQIDNIYRSSVYGYGAVGTEVGGFYQQKSNATQLVRYAQFGCMTACMINGGENGAFSAHLPWWHSKEVADIYRQCVVLMKQLTPYKFSTLVDAHLHGGSLLKNMNLSEESHQLGDDIFTKAITSDNNTVTFHLPADDQWIDYWTGKTYTGGTTVTEEYPLDRFPLFVRSGAIIPMYDTAHKGKFVFRIYPDGKSSRTFHLPQGDGIDYFDCTVSYNETTGQVTLDADQEVNAVFVVGDKQLKAKGKKIITYAKKGNKAPTEKDMAGYLMVYFKEHGHNVYFAVSRDGRTFTDVNNGEPVMRGDTLALQKGIRDPHIYRGPDGAFYLCMTDLHIYAKQEGLRDTEWEREGWGWGNNRALVLMKSKDLIYWTKTNLRVDQAFPELADIGCAWAPATVYDEEAGKLLMTFTLRFGQKGAPALYYSYVNDDFDRLLTVPQKLFERNGIDSDITRVGDKYHLYYVSHEGVSGVKHAVSDRCNGGYVYEPEWCDPEEGACEAPTMWKMIGRDEWILMYDVFSARPNNMGFSSTTDFKHYTDLGLFNKDQMHTTNFESPKHGAVVHITEKELRRLQKKWKFKL